MPRAQLAAVSAYLGLILLTLAWEGWLAPSGPPGLWLTLKSLPLLVPLKGLLRGKRYTYAWSNFLVIAYFMEAVTLGIAHRRDALGLHSVLTYALLELLLCMTFFVAALAYVRATRVSAPPRDRARTGS